MTVPSSVPSPEASVQPYVNTQPPPSHPSHPLWAMTCCSAFGQALGLCAIQFYFFRGLCLCSARLEGAVLGGVAVMAEAPHGWFKHQQRSSYVWEVQVQSLEDRLSGKVLFLGFEWMTSHPIYTHRDGAWGGTVSLVFSFRGTHKDLTLVTKLSLSDLPLNTSP